MNNNKDKWNYETNMNSDIWHGGICDSREEAIAEATEEALYDNLKQFKIGLVKKFNCGIDVDDALERIADIAYEEVGEVAEDYLDDVTKEHREELQDKLDEVFYAWQKKYNYEPNFYQVINEEIINIEGDKINGK